MYTRHLAEKIRQSLTFAPVLLLTGPRQCGKTTLTKQVGQDQFFYTSLDQFMTYSSAIKDPIGFIHALPKPAILDEIQRLPELFLQIKVDVDQHRQAGRYMLTGSANPLLLPRLGDALTGRMSLHQLWPLSQGEIRGKKETFLKRAFAADFGSMRAS